ncbi:hypothetical protein BKA65DRAFT_356871, partial [Rhexocercosporidium sp. MPI-PUGE-AT-0058]
LPALQSALDPLYKSYVKLKNYFKLIYDYSLSDILRRLVFESVSYNTLIEYKKASGDLALLAVIESSSSYI